MPVELVFLVFSCRRNYSNYYYFKILSVRQTANRWTSRLWWCLLAKCQSLDPLKVCWPSSLSAAVRLLCLVLSHRIVTSIGRQEMYTGLWELWNHLIKCRWLYLGASQINIPRSQLTLCKLNSTQPSKAQKVRPVSKRPARSRQLGPDIRHISPVTSHFFIFSKRSRLHVKRNVGSKAGERSRRAQSKINKTQNQQTQPFGQMLWLAMARCSKLSCCPLLCSSCCFQDNAVASQEQTDKGTAAIEDVWGDARTRRRDKHRMSSPVGDSTEWGCFWLRC